MEESRLVVKLPKDLKIGGNLLGIKMPDKM